MLYSVSAPKIRKVCVAYQQISINIPYAPALSHLQIRDRHNKHI